MSIREWFSDLKDTFEGKFLAVFMGVVLVLSVAHVAAFAASGAGREDQPAAEELLSRDTTDLAPEPGQALISFSYENAKISVRGQDLVRPDLLVEADTLLTFKVVPDEGHKTTSVTAENTATGDSVAVASNGTTYSIASVDVANGLVVTVFTDVVEKPEFAQDITVQIAGKKRTEVYNGTNHTLEGYDYVVKDAEGVELDSRIVTVWAAPTFGVQAKNAGVYQLGLAKDDFTVTVENGEAYTLTDVQVVDGALEITRAPLTVAVSAAQKTEGEADPEFTYRYAGVAPGEKALFVGAPQRAPGESVGMYEIGLGTLTIADNAPFLTSNYEMVFESGMFSISK